MIRAAYAFQSQGLGKAILVGREELVLENMRAAGIDPDRGQAGDHQRPPVATATPSTSTSSTAACSARAILRRDVQRLINQDRNSFAAAMVALGHADGMVTGVTRNFDQALDEVLRVIDPAPGGRVMGMSIVLAKGRTLFIADTNVTEMPEAEDLVEIAIEAARAVRRLGFTPRVAFMSYSTFGNPLGERSAKVREAVALLDDARTSDFEYEGEMPPELALDPELRGQLSVHAPDRPGQCADHAGHPLGLDLHQAGAGAGRGDGGGAGAAGPVQAGADLPAVGLGLQDPDHGHHGRL